MKGHIVAFIVGLLFAIGLGVSGMTQPEKVISFLDLFGHWNPALAFVMVGAIGIHALAYPLITKRPSPILEDQFQIPKRTDLTPRLLVGAFMFGIGWGLGGFCPGPGLTSLASGNSESVVFVSCMLAGMTLFYFSKPLIDRFLR